VLRGQGVRSKVLRPTHFLEGGGGQKEKIQMRLLRPTETERGS